ncbi:replication-relaxation family protein [Bacillus sp. FJAT-47783]|uniref:replication-relaxation family protein n=1 Tax=Bacillus sp. FJAT-47783 TaxID=2922712 RepID=UPI001FABBEE8|nr:replication-relaxation family protein [Bacillus sp. FJAT-47783]
MKHLVLTEEDKNLFLNLHDYIYLDIDFIFHYIFDKYKTRMSATTRLLKLEESGYIKKFRASTPDSDRGKSANVYTLTSTGVATVEELQGYSRWKVQWTRDLPMWYMHSLHLARAVVSYKRQAIPLGLEVKDFVHETRAFYQFTSNKDDVIRPDGFIVVGAKNSEENFGIFLEMERSVTKKHVIQKKIERYTNFLKHSDAKVKYMHEKGLEAYVKHWQVMFISENEEKLKRTLRLLSMLKPKEGEKPSILRPDIHIPVHLTNLDDVMKNAFGEIYHHLHEGDYKRKRTL